MRLFTAAFLCALPALAAAQERPNTMIVLDGSGSMWGQIEGVNKIVIARDVLGGILDDFPADENLGLTVYGHRERGNCADIETVVQSGPGTVGAIREAAGGINPRGKTPMTDAIIAAAESLRYTEERATVILVSDGIETCHPDPCAAASALEEAGIDFTAHVVGFDVTDPEALAQMQCLAGNTGGTFTTASNADELTQALAQVTVAEPEPEPVPVTITLTARIGGENGPVITDPVFWRVDESNGDAQGNPIEVDLLEGSHVAEAYWTAQEATMSRQFIVTDQPRDIAVVFEEPAVTATITAPASAPLGSTVEIAWNGPNETDDYIGVGAVDATGGNRWKNYVYTRDGQTQPLLMPAQEGPHRIGYFHGSTRELLGEAIIELTPVEVSITAPAEAGAGSDIELAWVGPDYKDDYIGIGVVDATGGNQWQNYTYTREGSPTTLTIPPEPGAYVIRYFVGQDRTVLHSVNLTATEQSVSITAPAEAGAGSDIEIAWTGPDFKDDYIGIGAVGATGGNQWKNYTYTREGSPMMLTVPPTPGDYVISYFSGQDRSILASVNLTATALDYAITAPAQAPAGSDIEIAWVGPDFEDDYIGIGAVGATGGNRWKNYTYTREGSPNTLTVPIQPGEYVITYFSGQDRVEQVSVPFTATALSASVTAPAEAAAGSTIELGWTGPDYPDDYIGIGRADASGGSRWERYTYTREGAPLMLQMPDTPGAYVITYFAAQDRMPLAQVPITVTAQ